MKKVMFLAGALLLLPVASFAHVDPESNPIIYRADLERAKVANAVQKAAQGNKVDTEKEVSKKVKEQVLAQLSEEGKVFLEKINYFRKFFPEMLNNNKLSKQEKIDMITQQFVIGVTDEYSIYVKKQAAKMTSAQGKEVLKMEREKKVLLGILSEPIGEINWVKWMRDHYQQCGHQGTIKEEIGSFIW